MTRYIKQSILVLLICLCQTVWAQIYPVQAVSTVYSPYSSKISDYSNPLVNRINLQLITTDLAVQNRQVQLFLKIQGNGITAQSAAVLSGTLPIYINGGEITNLTSNELSSYFRFQNLQGLSTTQYSEPLPDGVYTICFQVYDLVTRKWLSQNSCATMYLMLNDPPQLNLPANNEQIASTTFPNINFSWTPRHLNATNVSYTFEIKEILNPTLDPAFAFETSNLLYKEEDLRTTNLLYDLSKPTLIPGKKYAWRVKAISTNGLAENNVFKNNGYSQINYFTYSSTCEAPRYLLSEQQGSNRVKIMWDGINTQQRYHIQYKKANTPNAEWFDTYTVNTQNLLTNLEPGYTYEFRVGATCEPTQYGITQSYTYSGIQTFAINKNDKATAYNCGIVPTIEIRNQQPLGAMVTNETFMAGDFPVKVLDVQGGNGMFSGSGYIQVPYLADTRIGVTFNNIRINADYQMLDGVVETTYDPNWGNVDFIDDLWDVNQQDIVVNFPIESIGFENGEIIVTGPNGQTETFPGGKDTIITGSDNKNYYVDANGTVTGPFDTAKGGKPTPENTDGVNKNGQAIAYTAEGIRVVFEKNSDTQFAFDQVAYNKELTSDYKKIGDTFVPFKAVPNGLTDKLLAKVTITDSKINVDSLFFKTQNGVEIKADKVGNDFVLNLKGAQKFAIEEVQATIKQGDKYKIAGVFNLVHVSPKSVSLKLVPTEGVSISDKQIDEIKAIYNQLAISVDIEVVPEFNISNYLVEGVLPTKDAFGDLSTYSPAQNAIINDFTKERNPELAYYIFVTNKTSNTGQSGYMRINGQFGFVFDQQPTTIAHELAHGAFKLEHPFKQYKNKGLAKKDTQALMDYAKGTEFLFTDWKQINDPTFKLYAFQSQSDGEDKGIVSVGIIGTEIAKDYDFNKQDCYIRLNSTYIGKFPKKILDLIDNIALDDTNKLVSIKIKKTSYNLSYNQDNQGNITSGYSLINFEQLSEDLINIDKITNKTLQSNLEKVQVTKKDRYIFYTNIPSDYFLYRFVNEDIKKCTTDEKILGIKNGVLGCITIDNCNDKQPENGSDDGKSPSNDPINGNKVYNYVTEIPDQAIDEILESLKLLAKENAKSDKNGGVKSILFITKNDDQVSKDLVLKEIELIKKSEERIIYLWFDFKNVTSDGKFESFDIVSGGSRSIPGRIATTDFGRFLASVQSEIFGDYYFGSNQNPFKLIFDGLAHLISQAKIPQRFYDPTLSDYNPIIYKYYKYLAKADPILRSGDFIIEQIDIPREQGVEELHLIFAYHCGLWNGIVDQFEGIAMTGSLLSQGVELIFNLELQKQFNSAYQSWKVNCETNNSSLTYAGCAWDMILDGIKKAHTEGSTPQIAQQYGKTTIDIASIAIAFTKAGKLANVNKFMDAIDPLNQVMKYTGKGVGVTFKLGDKAVKGAFVYSLEKLQFFSKYKLSIKFNNSNLYSGIPIPDVNLVKKADLEKKLNALTEAELNKLPRDENGIRLVEIDGEVIPIGPESKIDEIVNTAGSLVDDVVLTMKADFPNTWKFNKIGDDAFEVIDGTGKKWGTVYHDKIVCPARTQIGTAGNPILNKVPLVKNMKYEVDGIIYQTDELGRVLRTNTDLDDIVRVRLGNQQIRAVDIKDGIRGVDQGGHIVASRFFGPGEQINLYPQSANLNQGAWKQMENTWANAMVNGSDVKIEVEAIFSGTSKRPNSFKVKYTIDGQPFQENFINQ